MTEKENLRPAIFLDRDGTLNEVVLNQDGMEDSPFRSEDLVLLPGAAEFTRRVREAGYLAVLVTNQPGVAKGSITVTGLEQIHEHLLDLLAKDGGGLDRIYYCPHHPLGRAGFSSPFVQVCDCRKPAAGMLLRAAKELGIDPAQSWMVGDKLLDVQAGQSAGCRTILLRRLPSEQVSKSGPPPTCSAADLTEALDIILRSELLK
jgi:D-glycero-D-manno-heptose 1,7-bisphosphate phosphatase